MKKKKVKEKSKADQIKEALKTLQELTGITVSRVGICQGIFAKPNHIFYLAKSASGIEIRYEIETDFEKDLGEDAIIREVIRNFPKHSANVN